MEINGNMEAQILELDKVKKNDFSTQNNLKYFHVIDLSDSKKWNSIISSFQNYDVYYLSNYVKAFQIHGDGKPLLIYYERDNLRGVNVVMIRDISNFSPFKNRIKPGLSFDISTPYGYGGFLFDGDKSDYAIKLFYKSYTEFLKSEHIISEFVRYHPLLKNADIMKTVSKVIDLGKTISIDLESEDIIWANFSSNNRNNIRKAEKAGIQIYHSRSRELLYEFMNIYNNTMDNRQAAPYYYFERAFYDSINTDLPENYEVFYAVLDGKTLAMAIMIYANKQMHCHLIGYQIEFRNSASTNLIFYEAAKWGCRQGLKSMHIGGGIGSKEDDLLRFKKSFNRYSNNIFSVGTCIFNQEMYDFLVGIRMKKDSKFDTHSTFFPLYRVL